MNQLGYGKRGPHIIADGSYMADLGNRYAENIIIPNI